jgi:thiosulfate/3-mercaptopyruvate sulfurtransferase
VSSSSDTTIDPIVSAHWLQSNYEIVTVCDVRPGGATDPWTGYLEGHLPGAILVDLDAVLAGPPSPVFGRHPLPDPRHFAKALGALGIGAESTVVAYDDLGGAFAGRLVWMLRIIGQPAALLDGGGAAWKGITERGRVEVDPVDRAPVPWPTEAIADAGDVADHLEAGGVVIDSRAPERYRGETEPIDDVAGHVPGAINLPFADNLDGTAHFLDRDALAERFSGVGDPNPIVYCGSGVTACHNALAMEAVGRGLPRVYVGSWSGWSTEPGRRIAVGDES